MPPLNDIKLPSDIHLTRSQDGGLIVSDGFAELLESGFKAAKGQNTILDLEVRAREYLIDLTVKNTHALIQSVAFWAGNNKLAQNQIDDASPFFKEKMRDAIRYLIDPAKVALGLKRLSELPGLGFAIATNVYRFCCPDVAAAVNGRTSRFFNALNIIDALGSTKKATCFIMEPSAGKLSVCRATNFKRESE